MPFGLKNVRTTYQWLVNKVFIDKIGRIIEVYVDDTMVKSRTVEQHIQDMADTFAAFRLYNMKLNLEKCTFEVKAGKLVGFVVSQKGINVNPKKIQAMLDIPQPQSNKNI